MTHKSTRRFCNLLILRRRGNYDPHFPNFKQVEKVKTAILIAAPADLWAVGGSIEALPKTPFSRSCIVKGEKGKT
jgi:hypothetical protein